jgi:hypothetical protein
MDEFAEPLVGVWDVEIEAGGGHDETTFTFEADASSPLEPGTVLRHDPLGGWFGPAVTIVEVLNEPGIVRGRARARRS